MIVMRIEIHDERIGFRVLIPPRELPGDAPGFAIVHSGRDVQRIGVIRDTQFRVLGRRLPFVGIPLREARRCRRTYPDLIIEQPIYDDRRRRARALKNGDRSVGGFRLPR